MTWKCGNCHTVIIATADDCPVCSASRFMSRQPLETRDEYVNRLAPASTMQAISSDPFPPTQVAVGFVTADAYRERIEQNLRDRETVRRLWAFGKCLLWTLFSLVAVTAMAAFGAWLGGAWQSLQ